MDTLSTSNPAFVAYVLAAAALSLNLLGLWAFSGAARGKTQVTPNAEDAKGKTVAEVDPPEVARVLRAHRNAEANVVPFLILALLYVILGAGPTAARALFGAFVLFRYVHSFAYIGGKQPWRSIAFGLSGIAMLAVLVQDVRLVLGSG
jgi:uncharacterized MAPEG superfamily protein